MAWGTSRTEVELSRGEVNEEIARLRRSEGRLGAANAVLREARRAFQAAGAARDVERVDALRAEWDAAAAGQATA